MKSVHLVIPDLFLPKDFAAEVSTGLSLPALEKMLARGHSELLEPVLLEELLCNCFDVAYRGDAPIAAISAAFDGLGAGCWLRADPVSLNLQRDQLLLGGVQIGDEEAAALCASLNAHFSGQGMEFFAPHPQRWYVRLGTLPRISTTPLSQVIGRDVRGVLPSGEEAARWHQVFNEIQMLLHAHPLNETREARSEAIINSVWFWGGGCSENVALQRSYDSVSSDEESAGMFAVSSGVTFSVWREKWSGAANNGRQLLVWTGLRSAIQRGDLAGWRTALQDFENNHAHQIWQALRSGRIANLQIDILGEDSMRRTVLKRGDAWAFWRRARRLAEYSLV
jgi:hypothetical protein